MKGTLWYCYAVASRSSPGALDDVGGVSDTEVSAVRYNDLAAIVSPVPEAEFDESALRSGLEDIGWLESVARAHNRVVDEVTRRGTALPFRLATIFRDHEALTAMLAAREAELLAALARVSGMVELGVKVYASTASAPGADDKADTGSTEPDARPGLSYLRRKKHERDTRESGWRAAMEHAITTDEALTAMSGGRRAHRPQSPELTGISEQNVLNVAYLVAGDDIDAFVAAAQRLQDESAACRIEVTGPWAPYSFALDTAAGGAEGHEHQDGRDAVGAEPR
ncbi:GvpL/GvpF family gas vesicle protein [Saccharomonospora sp. NPDC006951]